MSKHFQITFFTPSFNRPHELCRLFLKLNQLSKLHNCFEWIVVDDGSNVNMAPTFEKIVKESEFPFEIIKRENAGKSSAINLGALKSRGKWFFIIDDDDYVDLNIISHFQNAISNLPSAKGIAFRKKYFNEKIVGKNTFTEDHFLKLKPNIAGELFRGDLAYFFKTESLKINLFPRFEGEKFVPELYVWNKIADSGDIFYHPTVAVYYCEYLETGLSNNFIKNLQRNPKGFLTYYFDQVTRSHSLYFFLKNTIRSFQCVFYLFFKRNNMF